MAQNYIMRSMKFEGALMVNVCDEELVGKKLVEGRLSITIDGRYFNGEVVNEQAAVRMLKSCDIANLVGRRIISKAVKENLADPRAVRFIDGVPFLMIYKFSA
ncbi:MAG: DUF424 family protein [Conexivisphaerales archaeon]